MVELSPQHRDALFQRILVDFDGFEDLVTFINRGDLEQCYGHGRRIGDGFRVVLDGGLGWQKRTVEPTTLLLSALDLRRILERI